MASADFRVGLKEHGDPSASISEANGRIAPSCVYPWSDSTDAPCQRRSVTPLLPKETVSAVNRRASKRSGGQGFRS
jgi:hypothetical protein